MESLPSLFKEYCRQNITANATPLPSAYKENLVHELRISPMRSVIQAWTVLDFYEYRHLWVEGFDTYFGYNNKEVTAEKILEIVHPDDQKDFGHLYSLVLEGLLNMPTPVKNIGHFCISYRIKNGNGEYVRIQETNNIIESDPDTNVPLINLSQINKLDNGSKSNRVSYYFLIRNEHHSVDIMQSYLKHYEDAINFFNQNELRIATLLKQGLTSQQIADRIFLSKHSIDKYRKMLLEKTQTSNTPQLLSYLTDLNLL